MKRFLMFLVIAIAVTSLGLSIYYFAKDNEVIFINNTQISINAGDTFKADDLLTFQNASKYTKVDYSGVKDNTVLTYNKNEGYYAAVKGGETNIVITTTNRAYSNLVIKVIVRDGTEEFPYIIDSEEELRAIGVEKEGNKFTASSHYELGKSIILTEKWTPIASFTGFINGAGFTISNVDISAYTQEEIDKTKIDNDGQLVDTAKTAVYTEYNTAIEAMENAGFVGELGIDDTTYQAGKIFNLNLKNVNIKGNFANVGAIAGISYGSIINCEVSTDSYIKYHYADGKVQSEEVIYNNIQSEKSGANVGGVVGYALGDQCLVDGIKQTYISTIERVSCHARIYLNSNQKVGGLVGIIKSGSITESYFDGYAISNTSGLTFGGLVYENTADTSISESTVIDNYALVKTLSDMPVGTVGGVAYVNYPTNAKEEYDEHHIFGNYFTAVRIYGEEATYVERNIDIFGDNNCDTEYAKYTALVTSAQLEITDTFVTYKQIVDGQEYIRYWDFENVWVMGEEAPKLNKQANSGSVYVIDDYSSLKGANTISATDNAQEIYNKLATGEGSFNIAADIDMNGFVWKPIASYSGTLTGTPVSDGNGGTRNPIISNIVIEAPATKANTGLFAKLTNTAQIYGITFENVTIKAATTNIDKAAWYVGTLAGYSDSAVVHSVSIKNVKVQDLTMQGFGGIIGYSKGKYNYIIDAVVDGVTFNGSYAQNAGGITAVNEGIISGTIKKGIYTTTNNIVVCANRIGGIACINSGTIQYAKGNVNCTLTSDNKKVYNASYAADDKIIQVAGIAAYNAGTLVTVEGSGTISVDTAKGYVVDVAGVVGYNCGVVDEACAKNVNITTNHNFAVYAGGIAGRTSVQIDTVMVKDVSIIASTLSTEQNNGSYVGGIAGLLCSRTSAIKVGYISNAIVKNCTLQGYFVGGLVGYSYGAVTKSYVKDTTIKGVFAGGLAAIIHNITTKDGSPLKSYDGNNSGSFKYNYAIVSIENIDSAVDTSTFAQEDVYNLVSKYKNSASAGIAVFVTYGSVVDNCYTVVNYIGGGIKAPTTLSKACGSNNKTTRKSNNSGIIKNTIYTSEDAGLIKNKNEGGKFVSEANLKPGNGTYTVLADNGFRSDMWIALAGELPTIIGLDNLVESKIPN